jgi:dynein intermediate chain
MADRKAELERKKAKLQAIREEKERRRREKEQKEVSYINSLLIILF